jgi:Tol biopolymer transport system component
MAIYPRFSTDGTKLTFVNGHFDDAGVYVSDLQGNNKVRISEVHQAGDDDAYPVFTADGTKVIYSSSKYGPNNDTYDLLMSSVTEAAEGTANRMFDGTATGIPLSLYPVVSSDGLFIYFIGIDDAAAQNLYKVSIAGGSPLKLKTVVTGTSALVMNLAYVQE